MSKSIGIKLADGGFYPILEEGKPAAASMELTTVKDYQKSVHVDLYRSEDNTMANAEFVDTLQIEVQPHPNGEPSLHLDIGLDENNVLSAKVTDPESGRQSDVSVPLNMLDPGKARSSGGPAFDDDTDDTIDLDNLVFDTADETPSGGEEEFENTKLSDDFFDNTLDDYLVDMPAEKENGGVLGVKSIQRNTDVPAEDIDITKDLSLENYDDTELEDSSFSIDADDLPPQRESAERIEDSDAFVSLTESDDVPGDFSADDDFDFDDGLHENITPFREDFSSTQSALVSDLYDKDNFPKDSFTEEKHTETSYYEKKKKTRTGVPLLICLLCAIICIIALLLFLFVIPSRINIRISGNGQENPPAETPAEQPQEPREVPEVDQIIFTDKPITIVPIAAPEQPAVSAQPSEEPPPQPSQETKAEQTPAAQTPQPAQPEPPVPPQEQLSPQSIPYKVKWGDTLWDIAWAYYRNPWRYTYIARYNGIKNPDKIVAGTTIYIPPR